MSNHRAPDDFFRQELEELRTLLKLGKDEALDFIEERKEEVSSLAMETRQRLGKVGHLSKEALSDSHQKLDELRVQLALGKMESHDDYERQREKIQNALTQAQAHLEELEESAEGKWDRLHHAFDARAEALKTKLDALSIHLGAGAVALREEVDELCDTFSEKVYEVSGFAAKEIHDARQAIRNRINKHRH